MVGPSTPLTSILLEEGIYDLSGYIATDIKGLMDLSDGPVCREVFDYGRMVSLKKNQYKEMEKDEK